MKIGFQTIKSLTGKCLLTRGMTMPKTFSTSTLQCSTKRSIGVFGACFDQGQPHAGVGDAPDLIRQAGLLDKLRSRGFQVTDHGNITKTREDGKLDKRLALGYNKQISQQVESIIKEDTFCLTLGGDHSVGLGTVAGHLSADPEAVVIWVDAHADINTMHSSDSGNVHGMPLSFNIKELNESQNNAVGEDLDWLVPNLSPSRLAFIGLRDVDQGEWKYIHKFGIPSFPMQTIDRIGITSAVESALHTIDPLKKRKIHLSFDIDVLDPKEAPATGTRVRGGLTLREALTLCELINETGRLTGMDLVEVNPSLAQNQSEIDTTVEAAVEVILAAMGDPRVTE